MNKGKEIYGVDMMDWKFKCPIVCNRLLHIC